MYLIFYFLLLYVKQIVTRREASFGKPKFLYSCRSFPWQLYAKKSPDFECIQKRQSYNILKIFK